MDTGEKELIEKFQAGESGVFDQLMQLFQEKALSLAFYWTGQREEALDIVQEAFLRMYKVLPGWKPRASLFTWLYRVIVNLAIDRARSAAQRPAVALDSLATLPDARKSHHPSLKLMGKEAGEMVARAVNELPPKQKAVFIFRHYQGLSLKEIAQVQGCSLGAVKANLFQALQKLQKILEPYYKI